MKKKTDTIVALILSVPNLIWGGYVLTKIWNWLIATQFNIFEITLVQAISIDFLITFLTYSVKAKEEYEDNLFTSRQIACFIAVLLFLIEASIIKMFI